jgi:hypothetical protein
MHGQRERLRLRRTVDTLDYWLYSLGLALVVAVVVFAG